MVVRPDNRPDFPPVFDVLVLATRARAKVAGLTLAERARRVAVRAGAERVFVAVEGDAAGVTAWAAERPGSPLVVVDATDHAVHVPLLRALESADGAARLAVDPTDAFAGALRADAARRAELVTAATAGPAAVVALAQAWRTAGVATAAHGPVARHPARTPAERRAAYTYLYRGMVMKPQDSWLVRNINRKVSYPFTRLLIPLTWLSPNMISIIVFLIGVSGCVYLTQPGYLPPVIGTSLLLFAGYLDGCDGEIARLRLESSKLGAWIDTMCDEATTVISITCFGLHAYNSYGHTYLAWAAGIGGALAILSVYCVYYFLLATGASNSQDYPISGGLVDKLKMLVRRESINLWSFVACVAGLADLLFALLLLGGVATAAILVPQHLALRRSRRVAAPSVA